MNDRHCCGLCGTPRHVVMIGEEEGTVLLCPHCDFANALTAGPPCKHRARNAPEARS